MMKAFLRSEKLPVAYMNTAKAYFDPLVCKIYKKSKSISRAYVVGISGSYGSGKSTLAKYLKLNLEVKNLKVLVLSIDDFYLRRSEREKLGKEIHPLLKTRGVPGTHDLNLLNSLFQNLDKKSSQKTAEIPYFDKAQDDRSRTEVTDLSKVDVLLLDGWCLGIQSLTTEDMEVELKHPINKLERDEDPNGAWRTYVEKQLGKLNEILTPNLDFLIFMKVTSFDYVLRNRLIQEQKLRSISGNKRNTMTDEQVKRFVQFAQRLTLRSFRSTQDQADITFILDEKQSVFGIAPKSLL